METDEPVGTKKDALAEAMEALTGDQEDENLTKPATNEGKILH